MINDTHKKKKTNDTHEEYTTSTHRTNGTHDTSRLERHKRDDTFSACGAGCGFCHLGKKEEYGGGMLCTAMRLSLIHI